MQVSAMKAYFQITEYCLSFAEVQPILCKDSANRKQRCKLACNLCRGAAYFMQR